VSKSISSYTPLFAFAPVFIIRPAGPYIFGLQLEPVKLGGRVSEEEEAVRSREGARVGGEFNALQ
jgi:hypothetical protein